VAGIAGAGIRSLVVVTGHLAATVEHHLAATSPIPVGFIRQSVQDGTAGALRLVRRAVGQEPFLLSWGDIATDPRHFRDVVATWRAGLAAAIGVNQMDDVGDLSAVVFGNNRLITSMVEKPVGDPPSFWNSSGVMILGPRIWGAMDNLAYSARGEFEVPEAINRLIADGESLEAVPLTGSWFDVGTTSSLNAARKAFGT
jgi:glucose-1-phosphate thymidylyltransferase